MGHMNMISRNVFVRDIFLYIVYITSRCMNLHRIFAF